MFRNYFRIAWRNLLKNKFYSGINILGLAIGISVALLIGLWIYDEVSFDSYFTKHKHLAQVMLTQSEEGESYTDGTVAMPVGDALRNRFQDDFKGVSLASFNGDHLLAAGDKKLSGAGRWVQRDFPGMLTLQMLEGSRDALKDPSSILLAQSLAKAIFGETDPMNKTLRLDNRIELKVGGVYKDMPHNTSFYESKLLLPWDNKENYLNVQTDWDNHCGELFVELPPTADLVKTSDKIKNVPTPYIKELHEEIMLQPMDELHLYSEFTNGKAVGGRIQFVWLFGTIGIFVLLLACINFMNLSTARSERRAKEVGVRKAIGSLRGQLIAQFLSESVMFSVLAFALALLFVQLSLPYFNGLSDKQMSITWSNPMFWLSALGFILLTGIVAGSYPAFYLSGFRPIQVLKGVFHAGRLATLPRKALVVVQFTVSISLIICTIIVFRQIKFAKDRPVGYSRDGLLTVNINTADFQGHYKEIRNDLLQTGAIEDMAESSHSPTYFPNNTGFDWSGRDPKHVAFFRNVTVTTDFGKTINWNINKGRDFSASLPTDSQAVILNEAAARIVGFKNPLGENIKANGHAFRIIGVTKDMVTQSPFDPMEPTAFFLKGYLGVITIRVLPTISMRQAIAKIEPVFKKYNPYSHFEYQFVDDNYATKFSNEERIGNLANFFTDLAVFISCLGLFGLASFVAEQRTKEIGVRKVLGATVFNLWRLLSKDFVILVLISLFVATPIAYYFMHGWLQNYSYRTEMPLWVFAIAGVGAIAITLLTVSFQAIKAAVANPVKSLRTE